MITQYKNGHITTSDGVHIFFNRLTSHASSPFLIFLHGSGGDLTALNPIRELLARLGHSSIALDIRGHGYSSRPRGSHNYAIHILARDVKELIEKEKLKNVIVIGHCLGGMVAIDLLSSYTMPQVKKLVLINTYYKAPHFSFLIRDSVPLRALVRMLGDIMPASHIKSRPDFIKFRGSADVSPPRILSDISHTSLKSYLYLLYQVAKYDDTAVISNIKVPTRILMGTHDSICTPPEQQELGRHILNATTVMIEKGNHVMVFDKAKEIGQCIDEFVKL